MCGIAGIFGPDAQRQIDAAQLRRMTRALQHRGPDGEGFHVEPGIGLGHRRLSVVDPAGGQQPMYNEDASVVLVFNGMIYNFAALRDELRAAGHVFRNASDTETIIHAWEEWGEQCLGHLSGMFAFALWDRNRSQLFLARDRLGKKPIFYATTESGCFVFASEITALVGMAGLPLRIDPLAVDDFFAFGYIPDPRSIYTRIRKLPAAHYLLVEHGAPAASPKRYWDIPAATHAITEGDAVLQLRALLHDCVADRLVADVPIGAFLSGGLDSSAVVATAAGLHARPLDTFTIGFPDAEDETPYASQIARRYGTLQHNQAAAQVDMIGAAREQAPLFGEPFGDSSSVYSHSVCALARRYATVAISGDGGDEVLAGYRRHRWHSLIEATRRYVSGPARRRVIGQLARIYPKLDRAPRWLRARHTLTELSLESAVGYARMLTKVHEHERRALFTTEFVAQIDGHDPAAQTIALMEQCPSEDALVQAQYVDLNTYLPGDILTKVDRTSMANGLEVRAPFLDQAFVTWGIGLPAALKLRGMHGKYILRQAMEPSLPKEILWRSKQGFAMSNAALFRREMPRLRKLLLDGYLQGGGIFNQAKLRSLLLEHETERFDHSAVLWLLLVFEGFLAQTAETELREPMLSPISRHRSDLAEQYQANAPND